MGRLNRRPHVSAAADRMDRQVSQLLTLFPGGGCLLINKALELKQQITKDPCIDPGYFRACLEFYESNAVERVAEKVFENGGYYPTIHHSDRISQLNHALKVLATEIFPDCNVSYLREKLLQHQHSHVEKVTDELLLEARWPERLEFGKLDRADYIKSESYKSHALNQLSLDYPQVWKSSIKAVLAENNWDYVKSFDQLAEMGSGGLWMTLCNFFRHWSLPKPGPSTAPAPDADFDNDLDILRRRIFESQSIEDAQVAKEMNEAEYAKHDQLITCDCCYGDYPFEELCFCSEAEHTFCHSCINNLLSEGLFGQGSLRGAARIACISMDGCNGCLSTQILEKVLPKDIWTAYEKSLFEESVLRAGLTIVQCASCGYCEVDESTKPLHSAMNSIKFLVLVAKWLMWDLQSDLQTAYERLIRERRGSVFRCRRPDCQQLTCLQCHQIVRGLHKCYEKEQDGLRLYVEKAMADAVKRTCPVCNLSFQKADGCNKIVCRCGYTMCYICRKDIRKESYAHFCDHFREVPGRPCDQCKKCDLYKTDPEDEAIKKAATRAKREYLLAHPEVAQPAQHTNTIVIGPLTTLEKLDGWRREAVLWVLQHGLRLIV